MRFTEMKCIPQGSTPSMSLRGQDMESAYTFRSAHIRGDLFALRAQRIILRR